ncbi:sporulation protein [Bacillus sp. HMF5848]|nr:sporulation protein [Bacillus sp. HMF5848]
MQERQKKQAEETQHQQPNQKAAEQQPAKQQPAKQEPAREKQPAQQQEPAQQQPAQQQTEQQQAAPAPAPQQQPDVNQQAAPPPAKTEQQPTAEQPKQEATQNAEGLSEFEREVVRLSNVQRKNNGLPELQADTALSKVAREKSNDMQKNGYFSHTSPTYGSPFDMMRDFGITYKSAGENIAQGQRTPEEVVNAWMNSEGHRKNILSADFTHIGVGHETGGNHWTQMFIKK